MSSIAMPGHIDGGDTLQFDAFPQGFSPDGGWSMKIRMKLRSATGTAGEVLLTADPNGAGFTFKATPQDTSAWQPGTYGWASWVEKPGAQATLERGQTVVLPSAQTFAGDTRTFDEIALEAIRAALSGVATTGQKSMQIGDRQIENFEPAELVKLENYFARRVQRLYGFSTRIYVRQGNA